MKYVIIGLGSVGRRHLRNLLSLGEKEVALVRSGRSTLPDDELRAFPAFRELGEALALKPAAAILANPTALHVNAALQAARAGCHLLVEKPLSHNLDGIDELRQVLREKGGKTLIGFQFRFHPGLQAVGEWIRRGAVGRVVSAHAHWGAYLPDWHPWEDYRVSYASRRDLGGGVLLTLCHPFDYLRWLVGEVQSAWGAVYSSGVLDVDVEDVADIGLRFSSGALASVHLDYLQRPPQHTLEVVGTEGTIRWEGGDGSASLFRASAGAWEVQSPPSGFERNDMFLEEMRHFVRVVHGLEEPACTLEDGIRALEIALEATEGSGPSPWRMFRLEGTSL